MNDLKIFSILFLLLVSGAVFSQEAKPHRIDQIFDSCRNSTGAGTQKDFQCLREALVNWDTRLNEIYAQLKKLLSAEQQQSLVLSQRQWLKYRDEEFKFIELQVKCLDGTMYPNYVLTCKIEVVKTRVIKLEAYLSFVKSMQ